MSAECLPTQSLAYPENQGPSAKTAVYLDTSVSSTNFGTSRTASGASPFANLLLWIERGPAAESASIYGFAINIEPIDVSALTAMSRGKGGVCTACGSTETRLDRLFAVLADQEEPELALVLTDLWFMSTEIEGSAQIAMRGSIQKIFASGRSIGVLGFEAPYTSPVYDLPGGTTLAKNSVTSRPYFVLIIGKPHEVEEMADRLKRDVLSETSELKSHFAHFTPTLVDEKPAATSFQSGLPLNEGAVRIAGEARTVLKASTLDLDRISFDRANAEEVSMDRPKGDQRIVGPIAQSSSGWAFDGAPEVGSTTLEIQTWRNAEAATGKACSRSDWLKADFSEALVARKYGALQLNLASTALPAGKEWFLMRFKVKAAGLEAKPAATQWLRDWSFSRLGEANEPGRSITPEDPPQLFPVLNLEAFTRLLEDEMGQAIQGQTIGHGQLVLVEE